MNCLKKESSYNARRDIFIVVFLGASGLIARELQWLLPLKPLIVGPPSKSTNLFRLFQETRFYDAYSGLFDLNLHILALSRPVGPF